MVQVKYYCHILAILSITNRIHSFDPFSVHITVSDGDVEVYFWLVPQSDKTNILITPRDVRTALFLAQQKLKYTEEHDQSLHDLGIFTDPKGTAYEVLILSGEEKLIDLVSERTYVSRIMTLGLEYLSQEFCIQESYERKDFYKYIIWKRFRVGGICNITTIPDENQYEANILQYRTIDGSYNNLKHPNWGSAYDIYPRILDPDYADYINKPRRGVNNEKLPNARNLRNVIIPSIDVPDSEINNAAMEMTQFISHDMTAQMMDKNLNKGMISCCTKDEKQILPKVKQHKSCFPIKVSKYDPFYSKYGIGCLNFIRSLTAPRGDCLLGWREQANVNTGYLDLSTVYGSNKPDNKKLRLYKDGLLIERSPGSKRLPPCKSNRKLFCYEAGDFRVSTHALLATIHTIFMREHNRVASILKTLNEHWSDERLYQEARRINIAVYQNTVYNELIPIFIRPNYGTSIIDHLNVEGFGECYDETLNGAITNDFAIGFRVLHTLIPGTIHMFGKDGRITGKFQFSDVVRNVSLLESDNGIDDILRGMTFTNSDSTGPFVTPELSNKIFKMKNPQGHDLITLDIMRARDHGIPSYSAYREFCGFPPLNTFEDALDHIPLEAVEMLKNIYKHPLDVEMYVGTILERPVPGGKVGPVTECLMMHQFKRSACGDRFFYLNQKQKYPFTPEQLNEIKKTSFSSIVCQNSEVETMPQYGYLLTSYSNPTVSCSDFPRMDFKSWKE